jgi:hypothetical protein
MQVASPRLAHLRIDGLRLKVIDYTCRTRGLKTYPSGKRPVNELRLAATFMLLTEVLRG